MKNFTKLIKTMRIMAIIAFVAITGLSMMSCIFIFDPSPNPNPCANHTQAAITITGLGEYNGEFAWIILGTGNTDKFESNSWSYISNGSVKIDLLCLTCDNLGFTPGNYWIDLIIEDFHDKLLYVGTAAARYISSGNNNMAFSLFKAPDPDPDPDPETGTLTITGLDAYNGHFVFADGFTGDYELYAAINVSGTSTSITTTGAEIKNGSVTLPVWGIFYDEDPDMGFQHIVKASYDGNDNIEFSVAVLELGYESHHWQLAPPMAYGTVTVTFNNGIATGVFIGEGESVGLTITGLGEFMDTGYFICAFAFDGSNIVAAEKIGPESDVGQGYPAIGVEVTGDSITLPVWEITTFGDVSGFDHVAKTYTGNDTKTLVIFIWENPSPLLYTERGYMYDNKGYGRIEVTFVNGIAEVEFVEYVSVD